MQSRKQVKNNESVTGSGRSTLRKGGMLIVPTIPEEERAGTEGGGRA